MKKLVLITFLILVTSFVFSASVLAQGATNPTQQEHAEALDDYNENGEVSSPVHVQNVEVSRLWAHVCLLDGSSCTTNPGQQQGYFRNSVLGKTTESIAFLYANPPAQTHEFIAYYAGKLRFAEPAYAQGIGFAGLSPLLDLWKAFRNIAYGFLILILAAVGLMMMFRMKIDPRTVISIQNALPRVIITLILITFSYAIVGLLIDVMYLIIFLTLVAFRSAIPFPDFQQAMVQYSGGPLNNLVNALFVPATGGARAIADIIATVIGGGSLTGIDTVVGAVIGGIIGTIINPGIGTLVGIGIGGGVGFGTGLAGGFTTNALLWLIVRLALLFAFLRILIMLISAYIQVILAVIFGPLQLMFGAIPNNGAFGSWFKNLIANLSVFPVTSIMLLLGMLLTNIAAHNTNLWTPPGLGGAAGEGVAGIIGLGIVLAIPSVGNTIKEALKAKAGVPTAFGAVAQPVGVLTSGGQQLFGLYHQIQSLIYYRSLGRGGQVGTPGGRP